MLLVEQTIRVRAYLGIQVAVKVSWKPITPTLHRRTDPDSLEPKSSPPGGLRRELEEE